MALVSPATRRGGNRLQKQALVVVRRSNGNFQDLIPRDKPIEPGKGSNYPIKMSYSDPAVIYSLYLSNVSVRPVFWVVF